MIKDNNSKRKDKQKSSASFTPTLPEAFLNKNIIELPTVNHYS
jgi:hypothetical protein